MDPPTRRPLAVIAGLLAFILPIAYSPNLIAGLWSTKYLVILVTGAAGLGLLAAAVVGARAPAVVAAAALVAWSGLSTVLSHNTRLAFWGYWGFGTGWLFITAIAGAYCLGRIAGKDAARYVALGALTTGVLNALLALTQTALDLSKAEGLAVESGRAAGLLGNPVYLAVLLTGCFWLLVRRGVDGDLRSCLPLLLVVAAGMQVTGSRLCIVFAILGLVAVAPWARLRTPIFAVVAIAGFAVGAFAAGLQGGTTATARSSDGAGSGLKARTEMWIASTHAIADRPIVGAGPGRFQAATSKYRTVEFTRAEGSSVYTDAHNVVVEYGVTTGLVGGAMLLIWLAAAFFGARAAPELLFLAVGLFAGHLVEPQSIAVTPLLFLALGAAAAAKIKVNLAADIDRGVSRPRWTMRLALLGAIAGTGAAVYFTIGFYALDVARLDFTPSAADRADRILPWPEATEQRARVAMLRFIETDDPRHLRSALRRREEAARIDPENPVLLIALANSQIQSGDRAGTIRSLRAALHYNPTSTTALNALADFAMQDGHLELAKPYLVRSLLADPAQPKVRQQLNDLRSR